MKKAIRILGLFLLTFFVITSVACKDDDDPADNDFFAGTYRGSISYNDGGSTNTSTNDGSVFVTKIASGTKYNFRFSNGIPDLNGLEFQKIGDNSLVMVGSNQTVYVRIDNNDLKMFYTADGKTWTANCKR